MTDSQKNANPFGCTQAEFLRIALRIWSTVLANLSAFTAFKALYSDKYVGDRIKEIETAQKLPELPAVVEAGKALRDKLATEAEDGILEWTRLERYIYTAYPKPDDLENMLKSAGKEHFAAARKNWDIAQSLLTAGSNFITKHTDALKANLNMPEAFPAKYDTALQAFSKTLAEFTAEKEARVAEIGKRGKTMLVLWNYLQAVCRDGQTIFAKDREKKKLFTFAAVKDVILGTLPGGIKGRVEDANGKGIPGVRITIAGREEVFFTDNKGRYEMLQLGAGTYLLSFSLEGYGTVEREFVVRAGVRTRAGVVVLGRVGG